MTSWLEHYEFVKARGDYHVPRGVVSTVVNDWAKTIGTPAWNYRTGLPLRGVHESFVFHFSPAMRQERNETILAEHAACLPRKNGRR